MSYRNPTPLKIGMTGKMFGAGYNVVGRAVISTDDDGRTYYWHEFYLQTSSGEVATLVFEQTERGGEWRWFKRFEPRNSLTVAEATTKHAGDSVRVDSLNVRVTRRARSRVFFVEGQVPEEVCVGKVAHYFNAGSGGGLIVASWVGDEIEFFRGMNISTAMVRMAFNLPALAMTDFTLVGRAPNASSPLLGLIALVLFVFFCVVMIGFGANQGKRLPAVIQTAAAASPLKIGTSGTLDGKTWRITGHDLVQISEVGFQFNRHEYSLLDDDGNTALLVYGLKPGSKDWMLFMPLQPTEPMTPAQAGAVRLGQTIKVDGTAATATELFYSDARRASDSPATEGSGRTNFCFIARSGRTFLLVRWNRDAINFFRGAPLKEAEVMKFN